MCAGLQRGLRKKYLRQTANFSHDPEAVSMSSVDAEDLIARLSGGPAPADRADFRNAAESALATSPQCSGEGSTYRVIAKIWRGYFIHLATPATAAGTRPRRSKTSSSRKDPRTAGPPIAALVASATSGDRHGILDCNALAGALREQGQLFGYETYLPKVRWCASRGRTRSRRVSALFPGYIFVHVEQLWRDISPFPA
jgi:hypothetical protein